MSLTRRAFLRNLGLALAGLAVARCGTQPGEDDAPRGRVRRAWLSLDELAETTGQNSESGEAMQSRLSADHRAALDELVAAGELSATAAGDVQAAFDAAAYHAWRAHAPITCYEPALVDYAPTTAANLGQQAALLAEMAAQGRLDSETVARARTAIERDVAFVALTNEEEQALYSRLIEAGQDFGAMPTFDQIELAIPPEAAEAALFLVEVLGRKRAAIPTP